ncbi:MAG: DegT/DnrJ/EryC1/StrS family aminotransferase [Candidatus Omnitrophota bacterium]|nr:DegT/DnrJ/EryC1/StrS family aminotransferase [Candidatus Omnitrophota bacterium]MBU1929455.1 DegT/DnrJ/EryC1/StrS family aminotransferase [Candidatus Omnitrophota bacterium]MBU2034821.1 DegT/DnrJ/EryC1/StrS family aminotransferase [Candidatus Omnitrophota bacterium]MBU2258117.1 DegT/DnrJ/EryC1/StrS family aminotransferase [Candidatus Omnitrophota bacterium]
MLKVRVGEFKLGLKEEKALIEVIDSGRLSEGQKTFEFEKKWADYTKTKYCVALNSGTSAVIAGLLALKHKFKIKDKAKVITSPLTFIATVNAIVHCGFKPVFVDVDKKTLVITPENIEKALKKEKGISIILPIHLMGYPADMDRINRLAAKYGQVVMEDAAQAHGSLYKGKPAGSLSQLGIFSFYIAHNIQAGEMGAITTNNQDIFKLVKKIKAHGRMCECNVCTRSKGVCPVLDNYKGKDDFDPRFYHDLIGFNFKIMEFQAALGLTQLKKADKIFRARSYNVKYLNSGLSGLADILQLPYYSEDVSYLAYPLVIKRTGIISRLDLRRELEKRGIETRPLFGCIPTQQPAYSFLRKKYLGRLPNAEYIGFNGFYIGCHQYLTKEDLNFIISSFHKIIKNR